jgi:hypothetical protein
VGIRERGQRQGGDAAKCGATVELDHQEIMLGLPRFGRN